MKIFARKEVCENLVTTAKKSFERFNYFECSVKRLKTGMSLKNDIIQFEIFTSDQKRLLLGTHKVMEFVLFIMTAQRYLEDESISTFSIETFGKDEYHIHIDNHTPITMRQFKEIMAENAAPKRTIN
jgi:hypothetical protein